MKKLKRTLALILSIVTLCLVAAVPASAYKQATYYKGHNIIYNNGNGFYYSEDSWRGGFLWLTKYKEKYYLTNDYYRCLNYYSDNWIANNGQTLSITKTKTKTSTISSTVSSELGVSYAGISGKIGASLTTSTSVSYSTSLGLSYNLKDYNANSVRIAAMGYISKFRVNHYEDGKFQNSTFTYAFDNGWGYEITLVYRY